MSTPAPPPLSAGAGDGRTATRICPICEACCGLELTIADGRVTAIRGDDADVFSHGYICPKGVALKDLHEDPDRLRMPMIKRDGKFVEATWDEAFAEIERRLPPLRAAHGKDAAAISLGNPNVHKPGLILYAGRLARALGSKNVFSASTLDQMPKQLSAGLMFGSWLSVPVPDIERTDYLLVIGANPVASNGSLWTVPDFRGKAKALRARGGKLVVVDPRRTETAEVADRHLFIRPGADVYLLLAMLQVLFAEGLTRPGPLAVHFIGMDEVTAVVAAFPPEAVAARCGIAAEDIRALAREFAAAPRAAAYSRIGACTQPYGTTVSWLVDVLNAVTGNLDREGGAMFPQAPAFAANTTGKPGSGKGVVTGRWRSRVSAAPEVMGELPAGCLAEEIETAGEGQVRALFTIASNPALSAPNGARLAAALETLDFMVSVDIYLNETTRHADVILPGRSPLEDGHYDIGLSQFGYRNAARWSEPVFAAPAGQPAEWEILLRLTAIVEGRRANCDLAAYDDELFAADARRQAGPAADAVIAALAGTRGPERQIDAALRGGPWGDKFGLKPSGLSLAALKATPQGIDLGPLAPRLPDLLRTPSGKVELAPAPLLADLDRARADLASNAPEMQIVGRRQVRSNNSWMHNLPVLAKGPYRCTVLVHPDDAARHGLAAGTTARIASAKGAVVAQVEISDEMMPGVLSLPHGWGHDQPGTRMRVAAERPGANLNALLDEDWRDPLSGNAVLSGMPVTIAPAQ